MERRGRFIAPTADLSALGGFSGTRIILLNRIIGQMQGQACSDYFVKPQDPEGMVASMREASPGEDEKDAMRVNHQALDHP